LKYLQKCIQANNETDFECEHTQKEGKKKRLDYNHQNKGKRAPSRVQRERLKMKKRKEKQKTNTNDLISLHKS
jgi:hypothetical protein